VNSPEIDSGATVTTCQHERQHVERGPTVPIFDPRVQKRHRRRRSWDYIVLTSASNKGSFEPATNTSIQ
jgi:hypothetical protein